MSDWVLPYPWPAGAGLPDSPGIKNMIPSYLYEQYSDDDDLQAFVGAQNDLQQQYLDWFNNVLLPIYTSDAISGLLLDWIGAGLYGYMRPTLSQGPTRLLGPYGTAFYGEAPLAYGTAHLVPPANSFLASDDIYKRALTWHFYKGDGKYFTITWLKRRVMRFLIGVNGAAPNIDQTYQVSVLFGPDRQATIIIYNSFQPVLTGPGIYGFGLAYGDGPAYGTAARVNQSLTPFPAAQLFQDAVQTGALELPFQWTWSCRIIG